MKQKLALRRIAENVRAFVRFIVEKPCFFGMGFYYAWLYLSFYSTSLFPDSGRSFSLVDATWAFGAWGFALFLALYLICLRRALLACPLRVIAFVAFVVTSAGTAVAALPSLMEAAAFGISESNAECFPEWQEMLAAGGMVVSGASSAGIVLLWGNAYTQLNTREILGVASGSMVIGAVVFIAAAKLPSSAVSVISIALPLASGACFVRCCVPDKQSGEPQKAKCKTSGWRHLHDERVDARENSLRSSWLADPRSSRMQSAQEKLAARSFSPRLVIPLFALFAFSLGGEVLRSLCTAIDGSPAFAEGLHVGYIASQGLGGGLWLLLAFATSDSVDLETVALKLARPAFIAMAAAFALLCLAPLSPSTSYGIFGLGFQYVRVFAFAMAIDMAKRCKFQAATAVALVHLPAALAPCASPAILPAANFLAAGGAFDWNIVFMAFTCAMFVIALFVLNEKDFLTVWGMSEFLPSAASSGTAQIATSASGGEAVEKVSGDGLLENTPKLVRDAQSGKASNAVQAASEQSAAGSGAAASVLRLSEEDRFRQLASTWHLTKRETEVAFLLARGRNLPYIEEKLVISHGTAQTHQRHIYEKTGVHSRREFLDLVERGATIDNGAADNAAVGNVFAEGVFVGGSGKA